MDPSRDPVEIFVDAMRDPSGRKFVVFPLDSCPYSELAVDALRTAYHEPGKVWQMYPVARQQKQRVKAFLQELVAALGDESYSGTFPAVFVDGNYIGGWTDLSQYLRDH